jgi:hypothetical protein
MQKIIVVVALATLAGCATVEKVAIDPGASNALRGKTLVRTSRAAVPDFSASTPGKAAFAVIGAFAAISDGNALIKSNQVPVPAGAIGQAVSAQLQSARGMQLVAAPVAVNSRDTAQIAAAASGKADYVLDVETVGWSFIYFPTSWNHYRVQHQAQGRLIDVANKKIVAQGNCSRDVAYSDSLPTYEQLVGNQAAGLKKELDVAAKECAAILGRDILAL